MPAYFWQTSSSCIPKQNILFHVLKHLIAGWNSIRREFHLVCIKTAVSSLSHCRPENCSAKVLEIAGVIRVLPGDRRSYRNSARPILHYCLWIQGRKIGVHFRDSICPSVLKSVVSVMEQQACVFQSGSASSRSF